MVLRPSVPLYRQIVSHFEREIFEGRLRPGDRIPPTKELAKQFGVNAETIQTSLRTLSDRGLVDRVRRSGTFVRPGIFDKSVAIVFGTRVFRDIDTAFYSVLLDRLTELFGERGWNHRYYIFGRKGGYDKTFHEFETGLSDGGIRAVVEFCVETRFDRWLTQKCSVPHTLCEEPFDVPVLVSLGIEHLQRHGRRNVVVMAHEHLLTKAEEAFGEFRRTHGGAGLQAIFLEVKPEQRDGYEQTKPLLASGRTFDAILTVCDTTFRGVAHALLEGGVSVPGDVALITHANKGIDLFYHLPLTRLEVDPEDYAAEIVKEMELRIEGEAYRAKPMTPRLIVGRTCGE